VAAVPSLAENDGRKTVMMLCRYAVSVAAPPDRVWSLIRDFQAVRNWHPGIDGCELTQDGGDTVRVITTKGGAVLREKLLEQDDTNRRYSYTIVESPLPIADYRSTIEVRPAGKDGSRSSIVWQGRFAATIPDEEKAMAAVAGIYEAGLEGLHAQLEA
jgi:Polyketide cyclase / dehydrase and lipid transport